MVSSGFDEKKWKKYLLEKLKINKFEKLKNLNIQCYMDEMKKLKIKKCFI